MPFLIGTDEAGYGPNLGPLVIAANMWKVASVETCLFESLAESVCNQPKSRSEVQIAIGDSKQVYQSGDSFRELERTVLTAMRVLGADVGCFADFVHKVGSDRPESVFEQVTYEWDELSVPAFHSSFELSELACRVDRESNEKGVKLVSLLSWLEFPESFNQGLSDFGNKASLLSARTCQLVKRLLDDCDDDVLIVCDKHGGRGHYAGLIQCHLTDMPVRVVHEGRDESIYRWEENGRSVEIRFVARGERFLPVALSSMTAKYMRELCMEAWNIFWRKNLPELRPTAGYPQDAKRFRNDIRHQQKQLGISDALIWREK